MPILPRSREKISLDSTKVDNTYVETKVEVNNKFTTTDIAETFDKIIKEDADEALSKIGGEKLTELNRGKKVINVIDWVMGNVYGMHKHSEEVGEIDDFFEFSSDSKNAYHAKGYNYYKNIIPKEDIIKYKNALSSTALDKQKAIVTEFENRLTTVFNLDSNHLNQVRTLLSSDEFDKPAGGRVRMYDESGYRFAGYEEEPQEWRYIPSALTENIYGEEYKTTSRYENVYDNDPSIDKGALHISLYGFDTSERFKKLQDDISRKTVELGQDMLFNKRENEYKLIKELATLEQLKDPDNAENNKLLEQLKALEEIEE